MQEPAWHLTLRSPTCKAQLDQGATWPTRQEEAWPLAGSILPTRHRFIREQPGQRGGRQQDARLGAALPAKHGLTRESAVPQGRKHHAGWEQPCLQDPAWPGSLANKLKGTMAICWKQPCPQEPNLMWRIQYFSTDSLTIISCKCCSHTSLPFCRLFSFQNLLISEFQSSEAYLFFFFPHSLALLEN